MSDKIHIYYRLLFIQDITESLTASEQEIMHELSTNLQQLEIAPFLEGDPSTSQRFPSYSKALEIIKSFQEKGDYEYIFLRGDLSNGKFKMIFSFDRSNPMTEEMMNEKYEEFRAWVSQERRSVKSVSDNWGGRREPKPNKPKFSVSTKDVNKAVMIASALLTHGEKSSANVTLSLSMLDIMNLSELLSNEGFNDIQYTFNHNSKEAQKLIKSLILTPSN